MSRRRTVHSARGANRLGTANLPGTASTPFDPSQLSLDGYWLASYPGASWPATSSSGSSGTGGALTSIATPSIGSPVNGYTPASFNGSSQFLKTPNNASTYTTTTTSSGFMLVNLVSNAVNTLLCTSGTGQYVVNLTGTATMQFMRFNGSGTDSTPNAAIASGTWQLVQWYYDGSTMAIRANGNAWSTASFSDSVQNLALAFEIFRDTSQTIYSQGQVLAVGLSKSLITQAQFDQIRSAYSSKFALSL